MDTEKQVIEWDSFMKTVPSFEELRDVEFVRRSGTINMITDNLTQELHDRCRYDGLAWILRCKKHKISWIRHWDSSVKFYVELHGPTNTWFTEDLVESWQEQELLLQEMQLQKKLAELRQKKSQMKLSKI